MNKQIRRPLLALCVFTVAAPFAGVPVSAQDIQINEKTMRDAWAEDEPQFDSLSNDPGYERRPYFDDYDTGNDRGPAPSAADEDAHERHRQSDDGTDFNRRR